jgi:hypothetical protein
MSKPSRGRLGASPLAACSAFAVTCCFSGCFSGGVPGDAVIACDSTDDCPADYTCSSVLGRCISIDPDPTAPAVNAATFTPAVVRLGEPCRVEIDVSSVLVAPPRLRTNGDALIVMEQTGEFAWVADAVGSTPGTTTVVADLVSGGIETLGADVGSFFVDDSAPALVNVEVEYRAGNSGAGGSGFVTLRDPPSAFAVSAQNNAHIALTFDEEAFVDVESADLVVENDVAEPVPDADLTRHSVTLRPISTTPREAIVEVELRVSDRVGNETTHRIPVALDTEPPAPLDESALLLRRSPWGASLQLRGRGAEVVIDGDVFAALPQPATLVVATRGAESAEIARTTLLATDTPTGGEPRDALRAPIIGIGVDVAEVDVIVFDGGGNASDVTEVSRTELLTSLVGKVPGRTTENPHRVVLVGTGAGAADPPIGSSFGTEEATGDELGGVDGVVASPQTRFALHATSGAGLQQRGFAFDPLRGAVVGAGASGIEGGLLLPQLRARGGALVQFDVVDPDETPAPPSIAGVAFHRGRGTIVALTGQLEVWELVSTPAGANWTPLLALAPTPPLRVAGIVADADGGLLLFGDDATQAWRFDGALAAPLAPLPFTAGEAAFAFDASCDCVVAFHASGDAMAVYAFDGATFSRVAVSSAPSAAFVRAAEDLVAGGVNVVGGADDGTGAVYDFSLAGGFTFVDAINAPDTPFSDPENGDRCVSSAGGLVCRTDAGYVQLSAGNSTLVAAHVDTRVVIPQAFGQLLAPDEIVVAFDETGPFSSGAYRWTLDVSGRRLVGACAECTDATLIAQPIAGGAAALLAATPGATDVAVLPIASGNGVAVVEVVDGTARARHLTVDTDVPMAGSPPPLPYGAITIDALRGEVLFSTAGGVGVVDDGGFSIVAGNIAEDLRNVVPLPRDDGTSAALFLDCDRFGGPLCRGADILTRPTTRFLNTGRVLVPQTPQAGQTLPVLVRSASGVQMLVDALASRFVLETDARTSAVVRIDLGAAGVSDVDAIDRIVVDAAVDICGGVVGALGRGGFVDVGEAAAGGVVIDDPAVIQGLRSAGAAWLRLRPACADGVIALDALDITLDVRAARP